MVGLQSLLEEQSSLTIFEPSNKAFANLGEDAFLNLFNDTDALKEVILYHILPEFVAFDDLDNVV